MTSPIPGRLSLLALTTVFTVMLSLDLMLGREQMAAVVNKLPAIVMAAIFGYALGMAAIVTVFVAWQSRRNR